MENSYQQAPGTNERAAHMEYQELAKIYHMDASPQRDSDNVRRAADRRNAESTFRLGYPSTGDEFFIAVPRELSVLNERVLTSEREISVQLKVLPGIAASALLRSLVLDEVVSSNEIEGVRSTRRQIKDALGSTRKDASHRRFTELAMLYMDLADGNARMPETPKDVRLIYDRVMDGEIGDKERLDGKLFRAEGVDVLNERNKVLHRGLEPESKIIEAVERMLTIATSDKIPALYRAIAAHYLFEYAHPFYDGNGRTGRYLLELYLGVSLSAATTLSLSRIIAEHKRRYYKAFATVEDPLNHGELTHFVYTLLDLISVAQEGVFSRLASATESFAELSETMKRVEADLALKKKETDALFILAQYETFGLFGDAPLPEIASRIGLKEQRARQHMQALEQRGAVVKVRGRNPVVFALSDSFKNRYGIAPAWDVGQ
ncbi:MAG: Fic family protein [Eggerthellaceae bacterium]